MWISHNPKTIEYMLEVNRSHFPELEGKLPAYYFEAIDTGGIASAKVIGSVPRAFYIAKMKAIKTQNPILYITLFENSGTSAYFVEGMIDICMHALKMGVNTIQFKGLSDNKYTTSLYEKFSEPIEMTMNASSEECFLYQMKTPFYFLEGGFAGGRFRKAS